MHASKCDYYEIGAKIIRILEKFLWSAKIAKRAGFFLRTGLSVGDSPVDPTIEPNV